MESGYASSGHHIFNAGYVSQGPNSDTESIRLSNFNTYKYNNAANNLNTITQNIRKISPNGIINAMNQASPSESGAMMDHIS